jgi:hypothetical protein
MFNRRVIALVDLIQDTVLRNNVSSFLRKKNLGVSKKVNRKVVELDGSKRDRLRTLFFVSLADIEVFVLNRKSSIYSLEERQKLFDKALKYIENIKNQK